MFSLIEIVSIPKMVRLIAPSVSALRFATSGFNSKDGAIDRPAPEP